MRGQAGGAPQYQDFERIHEHGAQNHMHPIDESQRGSEMVGYPEPIRNLSQTGQITIEEEEFAKCFYREVFQSGLMGRLVDCHEGTYSHDVHPDAHNPEILNRVLGIFALLDSVDEAILATVCALILELRSSGEDVPLNIEEVGRRVMGYASSNVNLGAGAALLRAAIWMIRFGYDNPEICAALVKEKQVYRELQLRSGCA